MTNAAPLPAEIDVLVVGSGPTGLACANLLGLFGVKTLLIERNAGVSTAPKAIMVDDEYHRLFATLGVAEQLEKHFVQGVGVTFYSPFGFPLVKVNGFITPNGYPNRSAIDQPTLESDLRDHAARWNDVTLAYGHALVDLKETQEGVSALVAKPDGKTDRVRARYVIGADGAGSKVRELAGIEFEGGSIDQPHVVVDVANDPDQARFSRFYCNPARPRNSVPAPFGGRRYEFMLLPGEDPNTMAEDNQLRNLIAMIRPPDQIEIIRKAVYYFHQKLVTRMAKGRLFLAGDSAHQMPPFGAQGMNSGGKDAANLCWKMVLVLRGIAGPALLETYHLERHAHAKAIVKLSVTIGRLTNIRSRPLALLRDAFFWSANRFPLVREWFARQRYLPRQRYRAGLVLDVPAKNDKESFVGRMLPGPTLAGGEKLDELLGHGFALVAIHASAAQPNHPLWQALSVGKVAIGDPPKGFRRVMGIDSRFDPVIDRHRGEVLIVRPDRYVAGAVLPERLDIAAIRLAAMVAVPSRDGLDTRPLKTSATV